MSSLIDALKQVPDPRQARGKSHPLWIVLLLIIMGTLAGYRGYRPLETFVHEHYEPLCQKLGIAIKPPSYSTFRRIMMALPFAALSDCFEQWMGNQSASLFADNTVSGLDGKRIRQKLSDASGKERFVGLVSLFGQEQGVTLQIQALTQSDNSELKVVESLLETLQLSGLVITMDALHTQKNTPVCAR